MEVARGWLEQKVAGALVRWKKQFYILRGDVLSAFSSEDQGSFMQGFLLDSDTTVRRLRRDHEQRQYCFTLLHHKILYYFSAPTPEERDSWVTSIIQQQQNISPAAALVPRYVPAIHQSSQAAAAAAAMRTSYSGNQASNTAGNQSTVSLSEIFGSMQGTENMQTQQQVYAAGGAPYAVSSPSSSSSSSFCFPGPALIPAASGSPFLASPPSGYSPVSDIFMSFEGRVQGEAVALAYQQQQHDQQQAPRKRKYERESMQL